MERVYDVLKSSSVLRVAWLRDRENLNIEVLRTMASEKKSFLTQLAQEEIERRKKDASKNKL